MKRGVQEEIEKWRFTRDIFEKMPLNTCEDSDLSRTMSGVRNTLVTQCDIYAFCSIMRVWVVDTMGEQHLILFHCSPSYDERMFSKGRALFAYCGGDV